QANLRFRWTFVRTNISGNYRIDDFKVYIGTLATPTTTELVMPQYMAGNQSAASNNGRAALAACVQFDNLTPNTTYDLRAGLALSSDPAPSANLLGFNYISGATFSTASTSTKVAAFTTTAQGSSGPVWVFLQPSGNAKFNPGTANMRIRFYYITTGGAIPGTPNYQTSSSITILDAGTTTTYSVSNGDDGAYIKISGSSAFATKYVLLYNNSAGTGSPLFAYQARTSTPTTALTNLTELPASISNIYTQTGASVIGDAPAVIPLGSINPGGVQRIEIRNVDNSIYAYFTKSDGIWNDNITSQNTITIGRGLFQTISLLKGVYDDVGIYGNITQAGDMTVNDSLDISSTTGLTIATNTLTLNGTITSSSTLTGSSTSNLTVGGSTTSSVGTLNFVSGSQTLATLTMNRTGVTGTAALLGSSNDLTATNLVLDNGILTTGDNLLTVTNVSGSASAATVAFTNDRDTTDLKQSFVALCDGNNNPITDTTGAKGFKIKSVGTTEKIIPIGYSYNTAPNRISLLDQSSPGDDYTITLFKGDILGTPKPRVNRIWHIKKSATANTNISMKLYFFKRTALFGSAANDEIEDGFIWNDARLLHRISPNTIPNGGFTNTSGGGILGINDVFNFTANTVPTEVYAQYSFGNSGDNTPAQTADGVRDFSGISYFSVANVENFILPVTIINLKAYQQGSAIKIDWTSLTENNVARYEIHRAGNAVDFTAIGTQAASATFAQEKNYSFTDLLPLNGNNYYRINAIDKDGKVILSNILMVTIGKGKEGISIYPNPIKGRAATIQFTNMQKGNYNVVVYSASGAKMLQKTIEHPGGSAAYQFMLPQSFASGMYHVRIIGDGIEVEKNLLIE
ncbi:MAG: T9SS type A sorting domain-containing protein, partial [Panacibacter sp.]